MKTVLDAYKTIVKVGALYGASTESHKHYMIAKQTCMNHTDPMLYLTSNVTYGIVFGAFKGAWYTGMFPLTLPIAYEINKRSES